LSANGYTIYYYNGKIKPYLRIFPLIFCKFPAVAPKFPSVGQNFRFLPFFSALEHSRSARDIFGIFAKKGLEILGFMLAFCAKLLYNYSIF